MNTSHEGPTVRRWLAGPVPKDVERALAKAARLPDVRHVAVMPDVHLAREVCVGTVLATSRTIYPAAVGGDIGCGIAAVAFECDADVLDEARAAERLLGKLREAVPVNKHRRPRDLPPGLDAVILSDPRLETLKRRDGRVQFGTLGRGNHFLEFQSDESGRLWLTVHSGSRAVGQAIRDHHVAPPPNATAGDEASPPSSDVRALVGASATAYLSDAEWARAYADASRRAMLDAAAEVMRSLFGVRRVDETLVAGDHNHVRREAHFGEELWVHRKGAASARDGERGVIPGSMGTASFIVEGRGNREALCSSSHGAGRTMSRDEARRRVSTRELSRQLHGVWFDARAAPRLREEAPSAYKDIGSVMRAQRDLVRIVHTLRPVLSYKGA
jgi:tRNA-splicing ligase RtcB